MAKTPTKEKSGAGEGKGKTRSVPAEVHNARRRAAKARQRVNRAKGCKAYSGKSIFEEMRDDRRNAARERREAQEAAKTEFRMNQAERALQSRAITSLNEGSIAHKAALLVIESFPQVDPKPGISRTVAAEEFMHSQLSHEEALRVRAVKLGISAARTALRGAYIALTKAPV